MAGREEEEVVWTLRQTYGPEIGGCAPLGEESWVPI